MGKKASNERARPETPSFGELMRNPTKYAADYPEPLEEIGRFMIGLALWVESAEFKRVAALAERMSLHDPALYAALADMPGAAVQRFADVVRSASSATAAAKKPAPAWHAAAKREAARLIKQGINPRNVASKLACLPQFSAYTLRTIRNALR